MAALRASGRFTTSAPECSTTKTPSAALQSNHVQLSSSHLTPGSSRDIPSSPSIKSQHNHTKAALANHDAADDPFVLVCAPFGKTQPNLPDPLLTTVANSRQRHRSNDSTIMVSLAPFVLRRPWLTKMLMPAASWYANAAGYRKLGLRFDDLLEEEREAVQIAIKRLSDQESYDRIYRLRRATQCSYQHKLLPKEDWTKPEEDVPYLRTIIAQVEAELAEKDALDSMTVIKKH
ncbi:hypothetical protein V2A60_009489 [Cordyceps javanica]|uniref:Complex III subunit 7 n=1 Tax=Cordyceps javanica TaxID=43265 RepID=A0A545VML6_9HYPO|nr:ubiquinol-cytochrome C reductase-like protein [Cordyceps javanica]TQW02906.1 ubiquinol-cytochrome C reductase-like protein [Cordyceps javanica]